MQLHERASSVPLNSYDRQDWQKGYESVTQEEDYWVEDIEGEIPPELNGTLFRNGPGLLDVNGHHIHHPFDGDGMISAISFSNGRAHFRNRFIRTTAYVEEQKAQKILYRGVFGTQKPGGWLANAFDLRLKNIANTNVIYWGDKLLALWEAADPHRLDPYTLETLGKESFNGVLADGEAFAAHPRFDPSSKFDNGEPSLVNFSIKPGLSTTITIFELNPAGDVIREHAHSVPGFAFIHDFAITPNYCIFFQNPVAFNPIPFVLGIRGAAECIKFQPNQPTRIVIIPRDSKKSVQVLETHSGFVFHHANAFEQGEDVYIDSICYESFPEVKPQSDFRQVDFDALKPGQLWRFHLNLNDKTVSRESIESRCCEFPSIHPQKVGHPYRYLYMGAADGETGNAPLQAILKIDLESKERQLWSVAPRGYVSEPIFVERPNGKTEDDGWLLTVVYDSAHHRSDVVILDALDLSKGAKPCDSASAIATLHLKHHIPYGLHGSFAPTSFAPQA